MRTGLEMQAENLRKMFLAMAKDIRVILIKLADRLHNMRTLKYQSKEAQQRIARETQDIYCPIAQRLGISKIKIELEDLCMKYLYPDAYYDLVEKVALRKTERDTYIQGLVNDVKKYVSDAGIKAEIYGRAKHFFSIYKKMVNQDKTIDQIYDLFATGFWWIPYRIATQCLVSYMRSISLYRAVSRTILPCRSRTCTSRFIRHS